MNFMIDCTREGTVTYPLHSHNYYEIMHYVKGKGIMKTPDKDYPFCPGTVILVPPGVMHGSTSENGFKNIVLGGDFFNLIHTKSIMTFTDNETWEATTLANLIFDNRFGNKDYLESLCRAYTQFLLINTEHDASINKAIKEVIYKTEQSFADCETDIKSFLKESGYAPDYIRTKFKEATGQTPVEFITKIRINHAKHLIDVYGESLTLLEIAHMCGYDDYVYFSKKFKSITKLTPTKYKALHQRWI